MTPNFQTKIAPSILSADFANLQNEIEAVEEAGADLIHLDVMDGHFVSNLTFGAPVVKSLRKTTKLIFDTHLMIENPENFIENFANAGSDWITVHLEASNDIESIFKQISNLNIKPGLSIKPSTAIEKIEPYLGALHHLLIMTVEPGFGGQQILDENIAKITEAKNLRQQTNSNFLIEVDGGIKPGEISRKILNAGADILVAGSAIFNCPQTQYSEVISNLKAI